MSTKQREAKIQTRAAVLDDPRLSQFDEQDEATVSEIWHAVERNKSLSTELAWDAYQITQTLHATREYESCHCGVTH